MLYCVIEIQPSRELGETEEKGLPKFIESPIFIGRDDWIRTSDLSHPKRTRYQTALRPEIPNFKSNFTTEDCQTRLFLRLVTMAVIGSALAFPAAPAGV